MSDRDLANNILILRDEDPDYTGYVGTIVLFPYQYWEEDSDANYILAFVPKLDTKQVVPDVDMFGHQAMSPEYVELLSNETNPELIDETLKQLKLSGYTDMKILKSYDEEEAYAYRLAQKRKLQKRLGLNLEQLDKEY